jgi:hypothetical protein
MQRTMHQVQSDDRCLRSPPSSRFQPLTASLFGGRRTSMQGREFLTALAGAVAGQPALQLVGMLPMAIGPGQDAPLGRAAIGGLIFATCATLSFVHSHYALAIVRLSACLRDVLNSRSAPPGRQLRSAQALRWVTWSWAWPCFQRARAGRDRNVGARSSAEPIRPSELCLVQHSGACASFRRDRGYRPKRPRSARSRFGRTGTRLWRFSFAATPHWTNGKRLESYAREMGSADRPPGDVLAVVKATNPV